MARCAGRRNGNVNEQRSADFGLGIDTGVRACGIAIVVRAAGRWAFCDSQTVKSTTKEPLVARLRRIHDALDHLLNERQFGELIRWVAIEDPLKVIVGKAAQRESNFMAMRLLVVLGMGCDWAFRLDKPLVLPEVGDVKRAVGAPRTARPDQVVRCVRAIVDDCPASLDEHQAHAVGAAIAGARMLQIDLALAKARKRK
jgi:Holliday junction resolvasome RuvABC endonuclease subunit